MPDTITVAYISDTHINSSVSVCVPVTNLDDGGTYHASPAQRWLWDNWVDFWDNVKSRKGQKVAIFGGDLVELDTKRRSNQIISPDKAVIQKLVTDTIEPALQAVDSVIFIRGTQAHVGKSAWSEEDIANDATNTFRESENRASWYNFIGMIGDKKFDVSHHAAMGALPWTYKNAANSLQAKALWHYCVNLKTAPPDVVLRAHNHRYAESAGETLAIFAPCWTLITEYGYRTGHEMELADIGGVIFTIKPDKKIRHEYIRYAPENNRKTWQIQVLPKVS